MFSEHQRTAKSLPAPDRAVLVAPAARCARALLCPVTPSLLPSFQDVSLSLHFLLVLSLPLCAGTFPHALTLLELCCCIQTRAAAAGTAPPQLFGSSCCSIIACLEADPSRKSWAEPGQQQPRLRKSCQGPGEERWRRRRMPKTRMLPADSTDVKSEVI